MSSPCANPKEVKMSYSFEKLYEKQNRSVGIAFWHIEFCTKYRYKMFNKPKYKNLMTACIRQACFKHEIKVIVINVMPEHVHLIVKVSVNLNPTKLLQLIKGGSAYLFFKHHSKARYRYPRGHLWSKGKFIASVDFTDLDFTITYILHQEEHHSSSIIARHGNQTL